MSRLLQRSVEIILENQSLIGAYMACPNFPNYQYCWFRDGAFTAYAMDLVGEHDSASRFYKWAADTVLARKWNIRQAVKKAQNGMGLEADDLLDTRYEMDGSSGRDDWPNFQLDGFGTWLWALAEHQRLRSGSLPIELLQAAELVADYIAALWRMPCFDCWEEFPGKIHTYTLAALYAGLQAVEDLGIGGFGSTANEIRDFILNNAVRGDRFVKYIGSDLVDASLLGLAVPYSVVSPRNPAMRNTVSEIEAKLRRGGGVHRYEQDTYYGGGEWVLLTAWLGWYYAKIGKNNKARSLFMWTESQANSSGWLPEQVPETLIDASYYEPWRQRWGEIATPLLWSQAKYIILDSKI